MRFYSGSASDNDYFTDEDELNVLSDDELNIATQEAGLNYETEEEALLDFYDYTSDEIKTMSKANFLLLIKSQFPKTSNTEVEADYSL